ncbi:MAG: hypothetical protein K5695_09040 [Oscillospiraceae bacterium]|nr:hypothetical protein [Oscillospiraceae bacterium]
MADFFSLGGFNIPPEMIRPSEAPQPAPADPEPAPASADPVAEAPAEPAPAPAEPAFTGLGGFSIPADAIKQPEPVAEAPAEPAPVPAEPAFTGLGGFSIPADAIKQPEPVAEEPAEPAPAPAEPAPAPTILKKEKPEPEPVLPDLTPEEPEELDDDLFAAPEDAEQHSMFDDMQISFADAEQPFQAPEPAESIQSEAETVDEDEFTAPAAASKAVFDPWYGAEEKSIEIYDPDMLEAQLPAQLSYCTVLRNPDDKSRDASWVEACEKLYPASEEEMLKAVRACVAVKESVFSGPKVILMNKSWTAAEILEVPDIQSYLRHSAKKLWDEMLTMCEGTEPAEWVRDVWLMRLVERAVDYFTISSN